jgi:hypothetical protein
VPAYGTTPDILQAFIFSKITSEDCGDFLFAENPHMPAAA